MKFTTILLLLASLTGAIHAQNDDSGNILYPYSFGISSSHLVDGKIPFRSNRGGNRQVGGSLGIMLGTDQYKVYVTQIKTLIQIVDNGTVKASVTGPTFFKEDFIEDGFMYTTSKLRPYSISIHESELNESSSRLVVKYQFHYDTASNLIPDLDQSGWLPQIHYK